MPKKPDETPTMMQGQGSLQPGARAVGYARLSEEDKESGTVSLDNQKRDIEFFSKEQGLVLEEVFVEERTVSGQDWSRPAFTRMMERIKKGGIDVILATNQNRFARDPGALYKFLDDINFLGCQAMGVRDKRFIHKKDVITWIMAGVDLGPVKQGNEGFYSMRAGKIQAKLPFTTPPHGYKSPPAKIVYINGRKKVFHDEPWQIVQNEAEDVKKIFTLFVEKDMGPSDIAKTVFGTTEKREHVRKILRHPAYIGLLSVKDFVKHSSTGRRRATKEGTTPGQHIPIIEKELWQKAQEKINLKKNKKLY